MTLVPGGAIGVAERLKLPKMAAFADSEGFLREDMTRFNVIIAWDRTIWQWDSLGHKCINH